MSVNPKKSIDYQLTNERGESVHCRGGTGVCGKRVSDEEVLICKSCNSRFHFQCQGINSSKYADIIRLWDDMMWYCLSCKRTIGVLISKVNELEARVSKNSKNIVVINDKCDKNVKNIAANTSNITDLKLEIDHVKTIDSKKANLILRGLPENTALTEDGSSDSTQMITDFEAVQAICDDTIHLEPSDITSLKRLEKKTRCL